MIWTSSVYLSDTGLESELAYMASHTSDSFYNLLLKAFVEEPLTCAKALYVNSDVADESFPFGDAVQLVESDLVDVSGDHLIHCGNGATTETCFPHAVSDDSLHNVQCCSDTERTELDWQEKDCSIHESGKLYGTRYKSNCMGPKTWAEADQICTLAGARLCTLTEFTAGCTSQLGCGYDSSYVWTSTGQHYATCGAPGNDDGTTCTTRAFHDLRNHLESDSNVQCCSNTALEGWTEKQCSVYNTGVLYTTRFDPDGCFAKKTHFEAVEICEDAGGRLCKSHTHTDTH